MKQGLRSQIIHDIAAAAVPEDIDLWPAVKVQLCTAGAVDPTPRRAAPVWIGKYAWIAVACALAIIVGFTVALLPGWNGTEQVSAETILDRATSAAGETKVVNTYHLLMTRQDFVKGSGTAYSEVSFGGPDQQRTTERIVDGSGTQIQTQDVIFNGSEAWIVINQNGETQAIHTLGTTWNKPADDPSAQGGLAELLSRYGDKQCIAARLVNEERTVAGRDTYVVVVAQQPQGGCKPQLTASPAASPVPGSESAAHVSGQVTQSRVDNANQPFVWVAVDKQSFLPLQTEVRDAAGNVLQRMTVTQVEYNVSIPQATFAYTPPAGVAVSTFHGGNGADVKRALATTSKGAEQPPNKIHP